MQRERQGRSGWRQLLRQVPFFAGLDEVALEQVAEVCIRRELPPHTYLFYEGDHGHGLFVIAQGEIEIRKEVLPTPLVVTRRSVGEVIGELALLDGHPRSATAITATACVLYELSRERFLYCIQRQPELALGMLTVLTQRLRESDDQMAQRLLGVDARLAAFLRDRAKAVAPASVAPVCLGKLTNAEIGRQLSAARETISRRMDALAQQGIVGRDTQGLWVYRRDALDEIVAAKLG